jgi:hypothetical protein
MTGEYRVLGAAHGLLLGMVLASPLIAPSLLPWGIEALFIVAAFQLRLTDRRWGLRGGWLGLVSHIRMAPARLIPWGGIALVALMAEPEQARHALAILAAMLVGELLVYPLGTFLLGRLSRRGIGGLIALLLIGGALAEPGRVACYAMAFTLGMSGCVFWLRGPDGETGATMAALTGGIAALLGALLLPVTQGLAVPAGLLCLTLTFAHLSMMRRHPLHWRLPSGVGGLGLR